MYKSQAAEYISIVDHIFTCEDEMVDKYLCKKSFALNNTCVYEFMLNVCHTDLLKNAIPSLLNERKYEALLLLYSYMYDTKLLPQMKFYWSQYIYERGVYYLKGLQTTRESVVKVVSQIIDLKVLTDTVLDHCFQNDIAFRNAQIQSFQEFFNQQGKQAKMA